MEGRSGRLWAEAMGYACEVSNRCVTSSLDRGVWPYELWYGRRPTFDNIPPFGTLEYMRRLQPEHKIAPRGAKCIMVGPTIGYPRGALRVRDLTTGQVVMRHAINWHPPAVVGETGPTIASPGGKHRLHTPPRAGVRGHIPALSEL